MSRSKDKSKKNLIDDIVEKQAFEEIDYENKLLSKALLDRIAKEKHEYNMSKYSKLISYNGITLKDIPKKYRNEKEIVLAATKKLYDAPEFFPNYASDEYYYGNESGYAYVVFRNNKLVLYSFKPNETQYVYYSEAFIRKDDELYKLFDYSDLINDASEEILKDYDILNEILKHVHAIDKYINRFPEITNDKEFMLNAIKTHKKYLFQIGNNLRDDKKFVLKAISLVPDLKDGYFGPTYTLINEIRPLIRILSPCLVNDLEVRIAICKKADMTLEWAFEELQNDREVVLSAVKNDGLALQYVNEELRNDREVVLSAVKNDGFALQYANEELQNDRGVVLAAIRNNFIAFEFASEALRNDNEIIRELIINFIITINELDGLYLMIFFDINDNSYPNILHAFYNNFLVSLNAVSKDGLLLQYLSEEMRNNKVIVLEAIKNNALALQYASDELKNDREVVISAIKYNLLAFEYASVILRNDNEIIQVEIVECLKDVNEQSIKEIFRQCYDNNEYVFVYENTRNFIVHNFFVSLNTVSKDGSLLQYLSEEMRNNKVIGLEAIKNNALALQYASDELKNDREVVLSAVKNDGWALQYASDELKNDREVVLEAVKQSDYVLRYASDELKNDREFIYAAMKLQVNSLQYADENLKNDLELVYTAVENDGYFLMCVSDELQNDRGVVLAAIRNDFIAFEFASEALRNDDEIIRELIIKFIATINEEVPDDYFLESIFDINCTSYPNTLHVFYNNFLVSLNVVRKRGRLLKYFSEEMRDNKDIVLEAIKNDASAFQYASDDLKNDFELALLATRSDINQFVSVGTLDINKNTSKQLLKEPIFLIEYLSLKNYNVYQIYEDINCEYEKIRTRAINLVLKSIEKKLIKGA